MMLPILIPVSVAPVSYFFCASAPLVDAARMSSAADAVATLLEATGISDLPWMFVRASVFLVGIFCDAGASEYHLAAAIKNKPLRRRRRGCFFSSQAVQLA